MSAGPPMMTDTGLQEPCQVALVKYIPQGTGTKYIGCRIVYRHSDLLRKAAWPVEKAWRHSDFKLAAGFVVRFSNNDFGTIFYQVLGQAITHFTDPLEGNGQATKGW